MRIIFLCFFVYLCLGTPCFAAPAYGTNMPEQEQFFFGLQSHSVLNRYLEDQHGKMSSAQGFFLITYGIRDWVCLDLKGGAGWVKQQPAGGNRIDYSNYLGGGYGFRVKLYDYERTRAVFGFQHISIHPYSRIINNSKRKVVLDDWQFSLLVSKDFLNTTPYIGTRWSRMDCIQWVDNSRNRKKSERAKSVGLIVGIDVPLREKVWLNVEGQFFDAEAFSASLNFHF